MAINRKMMNESLSILKLDDLVLGYRDGLMDEATQDRFTVAHIDKDMDEWGPFFCEGFAEGADKSTDTVGCDENATLYIDNEDHTGQEWFCPSCFVELLGPSGTLQVLSGAITIRTNEKGN